jgi:hypothetical protein
VSLHAVLASSQFVLALEQVVAPSIEVAVALRHVCGVPLDLVLRLMQLDLKAMPVVVATRRNVGATARERFVSLGAITSGAAFRFRRASWNCVKRAEDRKAHRGGFV